MARKRPVVAGLVFQGEVGCGHQPNLPACGLSTDSTPLGPRGSDTVDGVRIAIRILALVVLGAVAFVTAGQYAPDGSWIQTASDQFLRALRVSWMIDPIAR